MKVDIISAAIEIGIDRRTVGVLKMLSEDGETVKMSQLIKVLNIMEYNDWDKFDEGIDLTVTLEKRSVLSSTPANLITITGPNDVATNQKPEKFEYDGSKLHYNIKGPTEEDIRLAKEKVKAEKKEKKAASNRVPIRNGKDKSKLAPEEFKTKISNYIKKNKQYTIAQMSRDLDMAPATVSKYLKEVDPERKGLSPSRRSGAKPSKGETTKMKPVARPMYQSKSTKKSKQRTTLNHDEIAALMKDYIDNHDNYTIIGMAKALDLGYSTISRHLDMVDPNREKQAERSKGKSHPNSIFNYMTLNDDEL